MPFFDFNYVTDPPNDELVNEQTQLNDNLDKLDSRLAQFQKGLDHITNPPLGTEAQLFGAVGVFTGTSWRYPVSIHNGWGSWQTLPLQSPVIARVDYTPRYKINTTIRKVILSGAVTYGPTPSMWPYSKVKITSNTGGISSFYNPVNNLAIQYVTAGAVTVDGGYAGARLFVESNGTNSVSISIHYQGDDNNGDFVSLDGVSWWF